MGICKWFTSTDVQVKYGTQIEGLLGTMGALRRLIPSASAAFMVAVGA